MRQVFLIVMLAALLVACGADGDSVLTEADDGSTVSLEVGETIEIELPSNPTTGFSWSVLPASLVSVSPPEFQADSTLIGAGGLESFTVTALEEGSVHLRFEYARPFESIPPEQVFEVDVEIN
jgi:inhibitor of cysteine peptidase